MPKHLSSLPLAARRALVTLGSDISAARRRRQLPLEILAERALTTRQTVARIERGDPRVAIGTWAAVLFALGFIDRLGALAEPARDELGQALETERLPQRVRLPTKRNARPALEESADRPNRRRPTEPRA